MRHAAHRILTASMLLVVASWFTVFAESRTPQELLERFRAMRTSVPPRILKFEITVKAQFENSARSPIHRTELEEYRTDGVQEALLSEYASRDPSGKIIREGRHAAYRLKEPDSYVSISSTPTSRPGGTYSTKKFLPYLGGKLSVGSRIDRQCFGDTIPVWEVLQSATQLRLEQQMESIEGFPCYVIDAITKHGHYRLWIDLEHGYQWRRVKVRKEGSDLLGGQPMDADLNQKDNAEMPYPMTAVKSYDLEISNVTVQQVEGTYLISGAKETSIETHVTGEKLTQVTDIRLSKATMNPDFEAMRAFVPDIPDGTKLRSLDSPNTYFVWENGRPEPVGPEPLVSVAAPGLDVAAWINCEPANLASFKGKVVVLAFWDSADESCTELVPFLNELLSRHQESNIEIVSIHSAGADIDALKQFISDQAIKFRVAVDKPATNKMYKGATFEKYTVRTVPSLYIIDGEGKIRYQDIALGAVEEALKGLLRQ